MDPVVEGSVCRIARFVISICDAIHLDMDRLASIDNARASSLLAALGEHLAADDGHLELVIIGGSALLALGLVDRVPS